MPNIKTSLSTLAAAGAMAVILLAPHGAAAASPERFTGRPDLSLAQRVQRLEDLEEIRELMYAYGRTLDGKDYVAYGQLFAADGTWNAIKGPEAITAAMVKTFGPGSGAKWTTDFHIFTNATIELDGDTAKALSKWQFVSPNDEGRAYINYSGHYEDVFVRDHGHWKFQSRKVLNDIAPPPPPPAAK